MTDSFIATATRLVEGNTFKFLTPELDWHWQSPLKRPDTPLLIPAVLKSSLKI